MGSNIPGSSRGRLALHKIGDPKTADKVADYLCAVFKKTSRESLLPVVQKALHSSIVISSDIPASSAKQVIAGLKGVGAVAVFIPHPAPEEKAGGRPPSTSPGAIPPPAAPVPVAVQASRPAAKRRYTLPILAAMLAAIIVWGAFFTSNNLFTASLKRFLPATVGERVLKGEAGRASAPGAGQYFLLNKTDPLGAFDRAYEVLYDRRIPEGFVEAVNAYARLFSKGAAPSVAVSFSHSRGAAQGYLLGYEVEIGGERKTYQVNIAADETGMTDILTVHAGLLERVAGDFEKHINPVPSLRMGASARRADAARLAESPDPLDMFEALRTAEDALSAKECDPALLYSAAEAYSWLAFYTNWYKDRAFSHRSATLAVADYLLARAAGGGKPEGAEGFNRGLLLVGLGYPAEAHAVLSRLTGDGKARLLAAYLAKDMASIAALERADPLRYGALALYLKGRGYEEEGQYQNAEKAYQLLMAQDPDFLFALGYGVMEGSVGQGRNGLPYHTVGVLGKNLRLFAEFLDFRGAGNDAGLDAEIAAPVNQEMAAEKWLGLQGKLAFRAHGVKGRGILLSADTVTGFAESEAKNVVYLSFDLFANKLAMSDNAENVANLATRLYPSGDLPRAIRLELFREYGKWEPTLQYVNSLNPATAGPVQLEAMLDTYGWMAMIDLNKRADLSAILERFRAMTPPNGAGLRSLHSYYQYYWYQPVAARYAERARKLDPFNPDYFAVALDGGDGENVLEAARGRIGKSYGFTMAAAEWHLKKGRRQEGLKLFEAAQKLAPAEYRPYSAIGNIHLEMRNYNKAIAVFSEYLKLDEDSLSAVAIQCRMAEVYMAMGQNDRAYQIMDRAKDSGQADALEMFAKVSEKAGKSLQAEEYFRTAAERYPSGDKPVELGLFYLRQGNTETAVEVFREYLRYHHPTYFVDGLFGYFDGKGVPQETAAVIEKVFSGGSNSEVLNAYADNLEKIGEFGPASDVLKGLFLSHQSPYVFVGRWVELEQKAKRLPMDKVTGEIIARLSANPPVLEMAGIQLLAWGHFGPAYEVFRSLGEMRERRRDIALLFMAFAWSAGEKDKERGDVIRALLGRYPVSPRQELMIRHLLGEADEKAVLESVTNADEACETHYLLGLSKTIRGDRSAGIKHLLIALDTRAANNIEYKFAYDLLETALK